MKIPVFLAMVVAQGLGLMLGQHELGFKLLLGALLGGVALAVSDRFYGYWVELKPFWRRGGEYLLATGLAAVLSGYAVSPFLKPLSHPWVGGVLCGVLAWGVGQAIELAARAWRSRAG